MVGAEAREGFRRLFRNPVNDNISQMVVIAMRGNL